ncbi:hypothetical protein DPMN_000921 [Dreissena polymorpha]|uniref:Uncharacterized protein n=1 Tax=Dreissena polymorpha TaxID=45954 RepID=A0A9D4RSG6_DREPO|nr:hypothetical protein DPMN_000921 [Dreissena polymorpha]
MDIDRDVVVETARKTTPLTLWQPCFSTDVTIKILSLDIIKTNVATKCHEDLNTNMTSRVLTRKTALPPEQMKTAPPLGGHFQTRPRYQTKNVASRVLTRQNVDDT